MTDANPTTATASDLQAVARMLATLDICMLTSRAEDGRLHGRPMSNNGKVEYDGDSWFFVNQESRTFSDVRSGPKVTISAQGSKGLLGKPPMFMSIEGQAEIITDQGVLADHWTKDLDRWWPEGPNTPGIALLKVHAERIHYWDGEDEGEVPLAGGR